MNRLFTTTSRFARNITGKANITAKQYNCGYATISLVLHRKTNKKGTSDCVQILVLGTRYGRRRCSSNSVFEGVSAYLRTHRICKVRIASHHNCEHSEQYHLPSGKYNFAKQNITAKQYHLSCTARQTKKGTQTSAFFVVLR